MTAILPAAALANHIAILGKTGSGKTSTAKLIVEQIVDDGDRVCILDPLKSDWWGLISSADGKTPGLPFQILGGPRGHAPLHSSAGKAIGEIVGRGDLPLSIIDMADFEPGGLQRFFIDFAAALMKSIRGVTYLVIEEAHEFAPKERAGIGAENLAIHWAKKLATAGRSKGVRLIFSTQRTQSLHNACLSSCETMIAHRLTTPDAQAPIVKWLRANTDKATASAVEASLSSLKTGTGWICSGEARLFEKIAFPKFRTYDNSRTPTRKLSDEAKVAAAAVDVVALRALIGDAVREAEENDPRRLRAEIAELKRKVAAPPAITPDIIAEFERRGLAAGWSLRARSLRDELGHIREAFGKADLALASLIASLDDGPPNLAPIETPAPRLGISATGAGRPSPTPITAPAAAPAPVNGEGRLGAERRPLQTLVNRYPAGFTEAQWATMTGMKRSGGTWSTYKSRLRTAGLIEERDSLWFATSAALTLLARVPDADPVALWKSALGAGPARIMDLFLERPAGAVASRDEIARHVNLEATGGTFSTYMSRLRSNGVIEKAGDGFRMAPELRTVS